MAEPFFRSFAGGGHLAIEEAPAAGGSADDDEVPSADSEHGAEGEIDTIGHAGGFVEENHGDGGEAAGGTVNGGKGDDAGAVGELEGVRIDAVWPELEVERDEEPFDFAECFTGLPAGGGDDEDGDSGMGVEAMGDEDGGDGGFAPLAVTVESNPLKGVGRAEQLFLGGFGVEAEEFPGEEDGVESGVEETGEVNGCLLFLLALWIG